VEKMDGNKWGKRAKGRRGKRRKDLVD